MAARRRRAIGWVLALGLGVFMFLGAADQSEQVVRVDAATYISRHVAGDSENGGSYIEPVHLFVAVTSPTGGAVDWLRRQNVRVRDAYHADPGGVEEYPNAPLAIQVVDFATLGGGFHRGDLAPNFDWDWDPYTVLIEIECPWGRGTTVSELPVGSSGEDAVW